MSKIIGQNIHVALSKESVAGTPVAPSAGDYLPFGGTIDFKNNKELEDTEANVGRFDTVQDKQVVNWDHDITVTSPLDVSLIGKLLLGFMGALTTSANSPESGAHTHTPDILDTGAITTFSLNVIVGAKMFVYPLGAVTSIKIDGSANKKPMLSFTLKTKKRAATTGLSASYSTLKYFKVASPSFYMPLAYSDIASANAIKMREYSIELSRELELLRYAGADTHEGVIMGALSTKVHLVKDYDTETFKTAETGYLDDDNMTNVTRAFRAQFLESSYTFGAATNPKLILDIPANKIIEHSTNGELKKIVGETLDLEHIDNLTNDVLIASLINGTASY